MKKKELCAAKVDEVVQPLYCCTLKKLTIVSVLPPGEYRKKYFENVVFSCSCLMGSFLLQKNILSKCNTS